MKTLKTILNEIHIASWNFYWVVKCSFELEQTSISNTQNEKIYLSHHFFKMILTIFFSAWRTLTEKKTFFDGITQLLAKLNFLQEYVALFLLKKINFQKLTKSFEVLELKKNYLHIISKLRIVCMFMNSRIV